jgi:hypothetical protein
MPERKPSRPTLACIGVCALILIVAAVDLAHTNSRLPADGSQACESGASSCFNTELSEQLARDRAADPLQRQYGSRAWLYSFATLAAIAIGTAYILRSNPRTRWPRIFTNLGVIGVWLGIGVVILLLATDGDSVKAPAGPALLLPVVLVFAAAVGTLMGRSEGWAEQSQVDGVRDRVMRIGRIAVHVGTGGQARRSKLEQLGRWLSLTALALTAVTCVSALTVGLAQPSCGTGIGPPGWTDVFAAVAAVAAVAAMAAGVGALVLRRWVVALVSFVACPLAVLLLLASTCAFY